VQRTPPHLITIARLDDRANEWGRAMIVRAKALFRRCMERSEWPGYATDPVTLALPTWSEFQLSDREQAGAFNPLDIADE
jgi:hypothetical protein